MPANGLRVNHYDFCGISLDVDKFSIGLMS